MPRIHFCHARGVQKFEGKKSTAIKWRHGRQRRRFSAKEFFAIPFPLAIVPIARFGDFGNHPLSFPELVGKKKPDR